MTPDFMPENLCEVGVLDLVAELVRTCRGSGLCIEEIVGALEGAKIVLLHPLEV